jgi:hypothetical protein
MTKMGFHPWPTTFVTDWIQFHDVTQIVTEWRHICDGNYHFVTDDQMWRDHSDQVQMVTNSSLMNISDNTGVFSDVTWTSSMPTSLLVFPREDVAVSPEEVDARLPISGRGPPRWWWSCCCRLSRGQLSLVELPQLASFIVNHVISIKLIILVHSVALIPAVTTPPEIIPYYRLNHSIWSLSDNKEISRWVLSGLHPVNHLET